MENFADLKKGVVAPCYLLYGDEEYLISETLGKMLDILVPPADRDFSLFVMDGETAELENLLEDLLTPSLLGGRKVMVVKDTTLFHSTENLADIVAKIRENLENHPALALKYFLVFLDLAGFSLEDLQNSGWKKYPMTNGIKLSRVMPVRNVPNGCRAFWRFAPEGRKTGNPLRMPPTDSKKF